MQDAPSYRRLARDFLAIACGSSPVPAGTEARPALGDPVYEAITEGRQQSAADYNRRNAARIASGELKAEHYSSCGDPAHWLLEMLGGRASWINRRALGHYHVGHNVIALASAPTVRVPKIGDAFDAGDVIIVNAATPATTHVHVFFEAESDASWITANYGQPGAALRRFAPSLIPGSVDRFRLGSRSADLALDLIALLQVLDTRGELVEARDPGAWLHSVAP